MLAWVGLIRTQRLIVLLVRVAVPRLTREITSSGLICLVVRGVMVWRLVWVI